MINELHDSGFAAENPIHMFDHTGSYFSSRENKGVWNATLLEGKNDAWVNVYMLTDVNELTKQIYYQMEA